MNTNDCLSKKKLIWSATPTPFLDDGSLDRGGVERLVERHVRLGASGLFVGGTCGEGGFMPDRQRAELVRLVKRAAGDSLHVAAHVSDTSAVRVAENIRAATDAGADSAVIAPPFMVADLCNRDFLRRYFLEPMEASALPVGIYVRPPLGKMELDLPLWDEVIAHPRVKFVKDSSGSVDCRDHFLKLKLRLPRLTLLTGHEFDVVAWAAEGYDGCLMGTGILNAGLIGRALDCLAAGDLAGANLWQERSNALLHDLFRKDISAWMSGLKYALRKLGAFASEFSHLSFPLTDDDRRRIDAALEREKDFL
ncbi:MAG: dihydrodipicolinate synthase family protein [Pirellulaceae bacterium]|nr:dihydrodipicolinate synthase family protein [Pirellulaceae bacterium]